MVTFLIAKNDLGGENPNLLIKVKLHICFMSEGISKIGKIKLTANLAKMYNFSEHGRFLDDIWSKEFQIAHLRGPQHNHGWWWWWLQWLWWWWCGGCGRHHYPNMQYWPP